MKRCLFIVVLLLSFYLLLGSILLCCLYSLPASRQPRCTNLQCRGLGTSLPDHQPLDLPKTPQSRKVLQEEEPQATHNGAVLQNWIDERHSRSMTASSKGFALLLLYSGQQSVGLRALISLQCMIGSFKLPVRVVEPFVEQSKFLAYPKHDKVPKMKDLFDIDRYNSISETQGSAELATWEDFTENAPRSVVLVRLSSSSCSCMRGRRRLPGQAKVEWNSNNTQACYNTSLESLGNIFEVRPDFCIVRVVNLTASPSVRLPVGQELHKLIYGERDFRSVTLIFDKWCPGTYILNRKLPNPAQCRDVCETGLNGMFHTSPQLLQHADNYERKYLQETEKTFSVAVMLRSERLVLSRKGNSVDKLNTLQTCLKSVPEVTKQLQGCKSSCTATTPFVTADVGRFGSGSWYLMAQNVTNLDRHSMEVVQDTVVTLLNRTMSFEEWENGFVEASGGLEDRGYLAALQRTIASRADCLVLVGGGNFIKLALHEYLLRHPNPQSWCVHYVCVDDFAQQYDRIIHDRKAEFLHNHLKELDAL